MLFYTHAGIRYLVLLAAVAVLGYAVWGLATRRPFDDRMRVLGGVYAALLHLQILLGVGVLFTGSFYPALGGHIVLMVFAAAAAQVVPSVMRRRPPEKRTYGPYLVSTLVSLGLVVAGILAIPGASVFGTRPR